MLYAIVSSAALVAIACSLVLPVTLFADTAKSLEDSALQASAASALSWLQLLDKSQYAQSWDQLSAVTKRTVKKEEWVHILDKTRKPLGAAKSREVVDQRTAKDPQGLPKGDYVVMVYKTAFAKSTSSELVTLYLEDGHWRVVTYQVGG
jgi:hypothetical protein